MTDPFDFESLRHNTPTYLGLKSLKDALPLPEEAPKADRYEAVDVSMEDRELSDEEDEDHAGMNVEYEEEASGELAPSEDKAAPASDLTGAQLEPSRVQKVLSPTQFGAHWALASPSDQKASHGYNYEIKMPIPAPWHENLAYTVSTYLQLLFNASIFLICAWLLRVAKHDVASLISERADQIDRDAALCNEKLILNNCAPHLVYDKNPALRDDCHEWASCAEKSSSNIRWLSLAASLASEVLNEFVEPLKLRTLLSIIALSLSMGLAVIAVNYLFGFLRARTYFTNDGAGAARGAGAGAETKREGPHKSLHISARRVENPVLHTVSNDSS